MSDLLPEVFALFPHALGAGLIIATVCALLGVFVVLKRVVFISVVLTQSAAAGIAASLMFDLPAMAGATLFSLATVTLLAYPYESRRVPRDAVLGAVFVFCSALSILIVSQSAFGLTEVQALLYGDLIVTSPRDFRIIAFVLIAVLVAFLFCLKPILLTFLDRDQAIVLGLRARMWEFFFFYMLGVVVSTASKVGGSLLVFCYLTVPAMVGLLLANRLGAVMIISAMVAAAASVFGLQTSYTTDLPTNQTIIVLHCLMLAAAAAVRLTIPLVKRARHRLMERRQARST